MPTTSYVDPASGWAAYVLQARTDPAGADVDDADGEDFRLVLEPYEPGILKPAAYQVTQNSPTGMSVRVGSGTAKADAAIIQGTDSGQGKYMARLGPGTTTVTVPASHASNPRIDQVFLVVRDNAYDSSGVVLPRIGYRQGDAAGSPVAPGPDGSWDAHLLIATIAVAASATSIVNANITDERVIAGPSPALMGAWEVDESTEVASIALTGSFADVASVILSIPVTWNTWKCQAYASWRASGTIGNTYFAVIRVDGTDQQVLESIHIPDFGPSGSEVAAVLPGSLGGRRTGIATTGSRTVSLRARESGAVTFSDVYLYARAVRTS